MKDVFPDWHRKEYSSIVTLINVYYECIKGFTWSGFQFYKGDLITLIKIKDDLALISYEGKWHQFDPLYPTNPTDKERRSVWENFRELSGEEEYKRLSAIKRFDL